MAQTASIYRAPGSMIDHTPSSAVTAGDVVLVGTVPCIAKSDIAANVKGALAIDGVFDMPQKAEIITAGDDVYWDATGNPVTGDAGSGALTGTPTSYYCGIAIATTAATDSYCRVKLNAATRTATIGGAVTATGIASEDSSLGVAGLNAAQGGAVAVTGGTSSTSANAGGAITLVGGTPGATGVGGAVSATGGAGGSTSGAGGAVAIAGGAGTAGNANGGAVTVLGGNAHGSGTDGAVSIGTSNTSAVTLAAASIPTSVAGPLTASVGASTAAAGSTTADAGALPAGTATVYPTTAADDTKGVVVNAADKVTGRMLLIGNGVSNKILKVYPPSGGSINGGSADAAFSSVSGKGVVMVCLSSGDNTWLAW